jgi:hypothetical protein
LSKRSDGQLTGVGGADDPGGVEDELDEPPPQM